MQGHAVLLPDTLQVARYRLSFLLESDLIVPEYAGSALRGIFGHSLRKTACMTRQKSCEGCPLLETCPYTRIFATPATENLNKSQQQNPPLPYVIEPLEEGKRFFSAGEIFSFNLVLIGDACFHLPLIVFSFERAFKQGVGSLRGRGVLTDVAVLQQEGCESIFIKRKIVAHSTTLLLPKHYPSTVTMSIKTPLWLKQQGDNLGVENFSIPVMLRQLLRRTSAIATLHWHQSLVIDIQQLWAEIDQIQAESQLEWKDWKRYSNRQQRSMLFGGVVGEICLSQVAPALSQLLYVGQWLHIGKETVFGQGRYALV